MSFVFHTTLRDKQYNRLESLKQADIEYGVRPFKQLMDIYKLGRGATKISDHDYYYFKLFDPALAEEKERFIGDTFRALMQKDTLDSYWFAIGLDKLVLYGLLQAHGLPFPEIQAVVHAYRHWPDAAKLDSEQELAAFLEGRARFPLFGKPISGGSSAGAISIEGYDVSKRELQLFGGETMALDAFWEAIQMFLEDGYLFQSRLRLHPELTAFLGKEASSTLRILVKLDNHGAELLRCTWKLPVGENYTDNFARSGNIIVAVNPETGMTEGAMQSAPPTYQPIERYPDTDKSLSGVQLPDWDKVKALCEQAAAVYHGGKLQGWDIMLTDQGPVIIELEPDGGGSTLSQAAQRKGLLDDKMKQHLAWAKAVRDAKYEG